MQHSKLPRWIVALGLGLLVAGCASTQSADSEPPTGGEVELPVERKVAGRIFDGHAPFVFKYRPGTWDDVRGAIESRMPRIQRLQMYNTIRESGPVDVLAERLNAEDLRDFVDDDRSMYLRVDQLGTDATTRIGTFGLPVTQSDPAPSGLYVRTLVPTDRPDEAASEAKESLEALSDGTLRRVQTFGSYLQVDLALPRGGEPREGMQRRFDEATEAPGGVPTPTPTMVRFLEADTAAAYTDLAGLREFGYARLAAELQEVTDQVAPENRMEFLARGFATVLNVGFANPASRQSWADAALVLETDGSDGLVADLSQTRTELGASLREETAETLPAPTLDDPAFEETTPVGRFSGALDVAALTAVGDETPFADLEDRGTLRLDSLAHALRSSGPWAYAGFLSAPEHLLYLISKGMSEARQPGFPLPSAASARIAVDEADGSFPVVGGLALRFEASEPQRRRIRTTFDRAVSMVGNRLPVRLETAYENVGGDSLRVTVGLGRSPDGLLADAERRAAGVDGELDLGAVGGVLGRFRSRGGGGAVSGMLQKLGPLKLRSAASRAERRVRLTLGVDEPGLPEPTARASLRPRPRDTGCLAELRLETVELFRALEQVGALEPEPLGEMIDRYDTEVDACDSVPEKDRRWARGRWRWFLAEFVAQQVRGRTRRLRTCAGESDAAGDKRRRACDDLRRSLELQDEEGPEAYIRKTAAMSKFASQLYGAACELGDDAGCLGEQQGFEELPEVDAVDEALTRSSEETDERGSNHGSDGDRTSDGPEGEPSKSKPSISPEPPEVRGALEKEIVRRVVRHHRREIKYCYEKELADDSDLEGRVDVQFTISPEGDVVAAVISKSTLGSQSVETCLTDKIKQWTFPEPKGDGIVKVNYPFEFSTAD